jgi:hypothetical protein
LSYIICCVKSSIPNRIIRLFLNSFMDLQPKLVQNNSVHGLKILLRQNPKKQGLRTCIHFYQIRVQCLHKNRV